MLVYADREIGVNLDEFWADADPEDLVGRTGSPLVIGVEDTEDSKPKDGRRWSIDRNTTWLVIEQA